MTENDMSYDSAYGQTDNYFGKNASRILVEYWQSLGKKRPVLDIGAGQGRNTLFLARQGLIVDAIDPSIVAIETIANIVAEENLPVSTCQCGFESFVPLTDFYSGILIFGLIQVLPREEISHLVRLVETWTSAGSLIFVSAFTVEDSGYERYKKNAKEIGRNSFIDQQGNAHTYMEPGEVRELFGRYQALCYREELGPLHRHGDGDPERHAEVLAVFKKTDKGEYIT
ncbi:MAG: methyltransferase domain-containing protein [Candidatus Zixiibacteriota bacterium]